MVRQRSAREGCLAAGLALTAARSACTWRAVHESTPCAAAEPESVGLVGAGPDEGGAGPVALVGVVPWPSPAGRGGLMRCGCSGRTDRAISATGILLAGGMRAPADLRLIREVTVEWARWLARSTAAAPAWRSTSQTVWLHPRRLSSASTMPRVRSSRPGLSGGHCSAAISLGLAVNTVSRRCTRSVGHCRMRAATNICRACKHRVQSRESIHANARAHRAKKSARPNRLVP